MTETQIRTYLSLGLKIKRRKWSGWLLMKNGVIYKHVAEAHPPGFEYEITEETLTTYITRNEKGGPWEIVL